MSRHCRHNTSLLPLVLILTASLVFYFLMTLFTQPHLDDLSYAHEYRHWLLGRDAFPGVDPWLKMVKTHFLSINGRFGDKLLIPFLWLPQWGKGIIAALSTAGFLWFAAAIVSGSPRRRPYLSTAVIAALILCLPWYDTMYLGCMTVNYTMGLLFSLAALYLFFYPGKRQNAAVCAGAALTGFLGGSWHECFTFIMAPGLIAFPFFAGRLSRRQWCVLAGGIAGGIFIVANPGFWTRYDNQMHMMTMRSWTSIFPYANISLLLLICCPAAVAIRSLRRRYSRTQLGVMTACFVALILNIVIFVSNLSFPRVLWYGVALGIIGLGVFALPLAAGKHRKPVRAFRIAVWAATAFCLAHMVCAAIWQYRIDREYRTIIDDYRNSPDCTVWYDTTDPASIPWLAMGRPYADQFTSWRLDHGTDTFFRKKNEYLSIVPTALKDFDPKASRMVNEEQGIMEYGGQIVVSADSVPYLRWRRVRLDYGTGKPVDTLKLCHRFTTADGRVWYYIPVTSANTVKKITIRT